MDGPVISNWKSLVIFLGDFSVPQMTKIEGMEEHGLLQMTIWMIRPPLCSSVPLQMVICKEDCPSDDQNQRDGGAQIVASDHLNDPASSVLLHSFANGHLQRGRFSG